MGYTPHGGPSGVIRANLTFVIYGYGPLQRLGYIAMGHDFPGYTPDVTIMVDRNPAGQISTLSRSNDAYVWTRHYAVNRTYTANGLNQYSAASSAAGTANYAYDANGNLTSDGTSTYTYDVENRLVGRSGGVALAYDPLGRLFEVTGGGTTTRFLYDGDALVAEYNSTGAMSRRYVHNEGADVPLLSYAGSGLTQLSYLHADHQGSIVAVSDSTGASAINTYDEYGIPGLGNSGRFQYTGQIWIPELGMYHYKARVYSPTLGRFLQTDPIGYQDQFNLYAYVGNDPVNATDPQGTQTEIQALGFPVASPLPQGHIFIWYRDVQTGETRIERSGPSPGSILGSLSDRLPRHGREGDLQLVAVDTPERTSEDHDRNGTTLIDRVVVPDSIDQVQAQFSRFNERVNQADIPYFALGPNSNTAAGDAFRMITGREINNTSGMSFPGLGMNLFPRPPVPPPVPCLPLKDWTGCR